ncbi:hypothetical protein EZS27_029496 [termite gut metagenome]|uniref:Uncharacterized protein n=1 Tax=termite gut metagenome TaxID=433724 RepID=A0A5J4QJR5_9ZZZZ
MSGIRKNKQPSIIKEALINKKKITEADTSNFKVSFQYLDTTQKFGSSFKDWQSCGLLSKMLETIAGYCRDSLFTQVDGDKFAIYGNYPPREKTCFEYPLHVPEDANWSRIHVNGPAVIVGHIINDTFYIVFLDKTHKFYLTKKVTGK